MNTETIALLFYNGVTDEMIDSNDNALVSKSYVDRCFYPFSAPVTLTNPVNGVFTIVPSVSNSYWVVRDFGSNNGLIDIDLTNNNQSVVTFELMIIKNNDSGIISFSNNIKWLEGIVPDISETGYIYFLVFRAVKVNDVWTIVGNNQGRVSINQ